MTPDIIMLGLIAFAGAFAFRRWLRLRRVERDRKRALDNLMGR